MERKPERKHSRWIITTMVLSLTVLWSFGGFSVASADNAGAICVVQINSGGGGKVFNVLTNAPQNFNIAIALPLTKTVNVPLPCDNVQSLALGMANQANNNVNVTIQLFTTDGVLFCSKGPFTLPPHGGRGATFTDCQ